MMPVKNITIASDISCDPVYEITTWAFYIKHDGGEIKQTGQFKEFYKNTAKAETYALINALTVAREQIKDWSESNVTIHNEIEYVLDPIKTKSGMIKQKDMDRTRAIMEIALPILNQAAKWERRKIKAHRSYWWKLPNPERYELNRWCDQQSRSFMRHIRDQNKALALT